MEQVPESARVPEARAAPCTRTPGAICAAHGAQEMQEEGMVRGSHFKDTSPALPTGEERRVSTLHIPVPDVPTPPPEPFLF